MSQELENKKTSQFPESKNRDLGTLVNQFIAAARDIKRGSPQSPLPLAAVLQSNRQKETSINSELAALIDHTLLKPDATQDEIRQICTEAIQYGFATVCVNSSYVGL